MIYKRQIKREYYLILLGFFGIFYMESLMFYGLTGETFFRITASQEYLAQADQSYNFFNRLSFSGLFHYPHLLLTNHLISYFFIIFLVFAIPYFISFRKKEDTMFLWLIPLLLYLSFGSSSFLTYTPFKAEIRYLEIIVMPLILILVSSFSIKKREWYRSFGINYLTEGEPLQKTKILILVVLFLTSIGAIYLNKDRGVLDDLRYMYSYVVEQSGNLPLNDGFLMYTDSRTIKAINYINGYKNNLNLKNYPSDMSNIKYSYILINNDMINKLGNKITLPKETKNPPNNWRILKEVGIKENKIVLYYTEKESQMCGVIQTVKYQ